MSLRNLITNKQSLPDHYRYIIMTDDGSGSIQLNVYHTEQDFGSNACIYALYVDEKYRKQGIATQLIKEAENIAFNVHSCDSAVLDYDAKESEHFVKKFYENIGYIAQFITFKKYKV